jgi:hypothetical protein
VRRLLLALLLLNIAFFGYTRFAAEQAPGTAEAPAPIPRLVLLSELKMPPGPSCLSVGPFSDRGVAEQVGGWLRGAHHLSRARSVEVDGPPTYWVALTTKTLQQAARISMRLKAAGLSDIEVTPPGTNQTAATVSLGVYSERARAERRVSDLRALAVNASITEQQHKVMQWWLDVPQRAGDPPLDPGALHKAVPAAAGAAVTPCPAPAPAGSPPPPAAVPDQSSPGPAPARLPGAPA